MANIDEKTAFGLIQGYYTNTGNQGDVLKTFLEALREPTEAAKKLHRSKATNKELTSDALYCLLELMGECNSEGTAKDFQKRYLTKLRGALKQSCNHKGMTEIEEGMVYDPNPNPEEAYIVKEQVKYITDFLNENYPATSVDQFTRRFVNGERLREIAFLYCVTEQSLDRKMKRMLLKVQEYMKVICCEG